jgi:hypothetical protein
VGHSHVRKIAKNDPERETDRRQAFDDFFVLYLLVPRERGMQYLLRYKIGQPPTNVPFFDCTFETYEKN